MKRRTIGLITTLALVILVGLFAADAQPAGKVPRIGWLRQGALAEPTLDEFRQGLRDMGYVEGQNIVIEYRFNEGKADLELFRDLAAELVRLGVDVIVTNGTPPTRAARDATQTIPIVFGGVGDPVGSGFVASLPRPGGNITGLSGQTTDLMEKSFQLLKEVVPGATRVAGLMGGPALDDPIVKPFVKSMQEAARSVGVHLHILHVPDPPNDLEDLERAFAALAHQPAEALYILTNPILDTH
ncbi:MAG: ABC transporter substrate-binding protein [Nitrospinae bacterium]|nr:ABC transporter substrate-binding protein [Nitrospinota bacterium]